MKFIVLFCGAVCLAGCGGDTPSVTAPPAASLLPTYKVAASYFDSGGKITVLQSGAAPITVGRDSALAEPAWSPDGSALAFAETHRMGTPSAAYSLHVWTPSGGIGPALASVPVTTFCSRSCNTFHESFYEAWSPDGKTLAYKAGASAIGLINADGTGSQNIPVQGTVGEIGWSPDGQTISFINHSSPSPSNLQGIGRSSPFTQKTLAALSSAISHYAWSPDGKTIAATGGNQLAFFNVGSTAATSVIGANNADWPVWSPDGTRVAFSSQIQDGTGNSDLFLVNKDGTALRRLTHASGFFWYLDWTPDGHFLLFLGVLDLRSADADGGAVSVLAQGPVTMSVSRK